MYVLSFLGFRPPRPIASPLVPDNRNPRFHTLSDTCFSDLVPFSFFPINLSLGLCFKSSARHLDISNYSRLGECRKQPNGKISRNLAYSIPISFCIGHWSSLDLEKYPFPSSFQHLISLSAGRTMNELDSFCLGDSWSIEMVTVPLSFAQGQASIW